MQKTMETIDFCCLKVFLYFLLLSSNHSFDAFGTKIAYLFISKMSPKFLKLNSIWSGTMIPCSTQACIGARYLSLKVITFLSRRQVSQRLISLSLCVHRLHCSCRYKTWSARRNCSNDPLPVEQHTRGNNESCKYRMPSPNKTNYRPHNTTYVYFGCHCVKRNTMKWLYIPVHAIDIYVNIIYIYTKSWLIFHIKWK